MRKRWLSFAVAVVIGLTGVLPVAAEELPSPEPVETALGDPVEDPAFSETSPDADIISDPAPDPEDSLYEEAADPAALNGAAASLNLTYHTPDEVKAYLAQHKIQFLNAAYDEKSSTVSPYAPGKVKREILEDALTTLNTMRYIAGLNDDVTLYDDYTARCQAGSLINAANGALSHHPEKPEGMEDALYQFGCSGTSRSNIAYGYGSLARTIIKGWMYDEDSGNISCVGHRRWVLNPSMRATGFGQAGIYTSMFAFDQSGSTDGKKSIWPGQSMPVQFFASDVPWSLSTGQVETMSDIKVTLTNRTTGAAWSFTKDASDGYFNVQNSYYGLQGCIIFRPDDVTYKSGEIWHVTIEGTKEGTFDYDVEFFDICKLAKTVSAPYEVYVPVGETVNVPVKLEPEDADEPLSWKVSDTTYAVIDEKGNLTGLEEGKTSLWVDGMYSDNYGHSWIHVYRPITELTFDKTEISMQRDETAVITPTILPLGTDTRLIWKSSNSLIANVSYKDGKATLTSNYGGECTITATDPADGTTASCHVTVYPFPLSNPSVEMTTGPTTKVYDGTTLHPEIKLMWRGSELKEGEDYTVKYPDYYYIGQRTFYVYGIGRFSSYRPVTVTIEKADNEVEISCADITYGGTPSPKLNSYKAYAPMTYTYSSDGGQTFSEEAPRAAGTYVVRGDAAETTYYKACSATATFTIRPLSIGSGKTSLDTSLFRTYKGKPVAMTPALSVDGKELKAGTDYTVNCSNNTGAGDARVVLTGRGNYTGTLEKSFKIRRYVSIAGNNRYETAASIAKAAFPKAPAEAILVTGQLYPDALAANAYAGAHNAPVLMTKPDKLSPATENLLKKTWGGKVTKVTIIGGGLSAQVEKGLKACGVRMIAHIAGKNRYLTAEEVCRAGLKEGLFTTDTVIVATGQSPADALSISPWSYKLKWPILLAKNGSVSASTKKLIAQFDKVILLGAEQTVRDSCLSEPQKAAAVRLAGKNRYQTSLAIAEYFKANGYGAYEAAAFACGDDKLFADALAGGMLEGRAGAPVILVKPGQKAVLDFVSAQFAGGSGAYEYRFLGSAGEGKSENFARITAAIESKD